MNKSQSPAPAGANSPTPGPYAAGVGEKIIVIQIEPPPPPPPQPPTGYPGGWKGFIFAIFVAVIAGWILDSTDGKDVWGFFEKTHERVFTGKPLEEDSENFTDSAETKQPDT